MERLAKITTALTTTDAFSKPTKAIPVNTDAVGKFIKTVRQHFPTGKKTDEEERDWVRSMAYVLRDYVPSELARAAEEIINTRETRYFPLPVECKKACDHARSMLRIRAGVEAAPATWPPLDKHIEPGRDIWKRRDVAWREEMRRKGVKLTGRKYGE